MITLFWIVAFCLGWRIVTDEGQLLHFIRKPFDDNYNFYETILQRIEHFERYDKSLVPSLKKTILKHKLINYIGKPFILCITCFASIWGVTVFVALNGLTVDLIPTLIITCISASFIQTFIWSLYVKYIQ